MARVVVTGIGAVLPGCDLRETFWRQLRDGDSQLAFEPCEDEHGGVRAVGRVRAFDPARDLAEIPERFYSVYPRELQLYLASVFRARDDAAVDLAQVAPERVGLFDGSARPCLSLWYDRARAEAAGEDAGFSRRDLMVALPGQTVGVAASLLHARGPTYTFAGACAAGAIAIGHAYREVRSGDVDVAFATGHDTALTPALFAMYRDANLLSREREDARRAVRPFVGYSANAFGEGALTLVLESEEHARRRGATVIAELAGYRYGNNGHHPTAVDVAGVRPAEVLRALLKSSGLAPGDVGLVVGHGNGVHLSDVSEENYMRLVFGARAREVPLLSTKPIYGHTLGASSAVSVAAAALMVQHAYVAPTINVDPAGVKRAVNHQADRGESRACEVALTMSYGMGGHNAATLIKRYRPDAAAAATPEGA